MKRAFIVAGPEASGTKLVTKILIAAGCHGDDTNEQWVHRALKEGYHFESDSVVLRLSMPCGLEKPDLDRYIWHFHCLGYTIQMIVTTRDWYAIKRAHLRGLTHALSENHSTNKIKAAYRDIFRTLNHTELDFRIVTYESLILNGKQAMTDILAWAGLSIETPEKLPEVYDGNAKYYRQESKQSRDSKAD